MSVGSQPTLAGSGWFPPIGGAEHGIMSQTEQSHSGPRWARVGALWCRAMHDRISWPLRGRYYCRHCNRLYAAPWD